MIVMIRVLRIIALAAAIVCCQNVAAANVTVRAVKADAATVFARIMAQTGLNFVYASDLLKGVEVSVDAKDCPLEEVLDRMFAGHGIEYKIKGDNVVLMRSKKQRRPTVTLSGFVVESGSREAVAGAVVRDNASGTATTTNAQGFYSLTVDAGMTTVTASFPGLKSLTTGETDLSRDMTLDFELSASTELDELIVIGSRNNALAVESAEVGSYNLSPTAIKNTPVVFGEADIIKSLQLQPGVSAGVEGFAGMYVHGGNADENLYMLDNIPLYQVNHFGGLFSAFNTEAVRNVDFYKSSFPARYDGRLSSFIDVHTKDGSLESHHGSARLGLTSGAFNIDGPIVRGKTSYSLAVRRSWFDLIMAPIFALSNIDSDDKLTMRYAFTDLNAKLTHNFSPRSRASLTVYYGDDMLKTRSKSTLTETTVYYDNERVDMRWGNLVASAGWRYVFSPVIFGEFNAAYTRYASALKHDWYDDYRENGEIMSFTHDINRSDNNISDWIVKGDFDWRPASDHRVTFGGSYTRHSFLPSKSRRHVITDRLETSSADSALTCRANEANAYINDDWRVSGRLRLSAGVHLSLFDIDGHIHTGVSPRLSLRYNVAQDMSLKLSYARAVQYVHQLTQSYISLPTDRWVPITGSFKPQTSDKIAAGYYWLVGGRYTLSAEAYYKWLDNLIDYRDDYYLAAPDTEWAASLTAGRGTARGLDFRAAKEAGRFTGHIAYSLMWADRTFDARNGGRTYPVRFDNRHKINIAVNWRVNDKWEINAAWTGMSGNRFTLPTEVWQSPDFNGTGNDVPLVTSLNNYRLPFYHRLDLGFVRHTRRGFWTFSFFNAYCNMNVVAVRRHEKNNGRRVFQQVRLLPIIPSISYTWKF